MITKQNTVNKETSQTQTPIECDLLKVAVDVHAAFFMVAYQMDGSKPKPVQKIKPGDFIEWLSKQIKKARKTVCCYEAGPTGFWLHRQIEALGATNYVVHPTCLDSRSKGVNTDKTDGLELLSRLDRYESGNKNAFTVVRVPTEEAEKRRVLPRQREQLRKTRLSLASMGRCLMLLHGLRQSNNWWKSAIWEELQIQVPAWLREHLKIYRELIITVQEQLAAMDKDIKAKASKERPKGMGPLSFEQLDGEVCDWGRFQTRRQVGSYGGLTGGVSGSGEKLADLSITKAGNKRVRTILIELAWRMVQFQPEYWLVKKWKGVLLNPKVHARRRKKAIVAFARQLFVDIWKWRTGRATAESLGWIMSH